jgi:hypothetical protein
MAGLGVFVFADDGVSYFQTAEEAAGWVEAIDVEAGEYKAFIRLDGERLEPRILDPSTVLLEESGQCDPGLLVELLERERVSHRTFTSDSAHPANVANELLLGNWEARWPKRPGWLDRRMHGDGPEGVKST